MAPSMTKSAGGRSSGAAGRAYMLPSAAYENVSVKGPAALGP